MKVGRGLAEEVTFALNPVACSRKQEESTGFLWPGGGGNARKGCGRRDRGTFRRRIGGEYVDGAGAGSARKGQDCSTSQALAETLDSILRSTGNYRKR